MPELIGAVRVHPGDDPRDPHARRVIRTDRDCDLPWVFLTGLESGRPGVDWRSRSDAEIGLGPYPGGREWPRQSLLELLDVLGYHSDKDGDTRG